MKLVKHISYFVLLLATMSLGASAQEPKGKFTITCTFHPGLMKTVVKVS